jgi:hypothetical protein
MFFGPLPHSQDKGNLRYSISRTLFSAYQLSQTALKAMATTRPMLG